MHVNKPSLNPIARAALIEIQAAGVEITPEIVLWVQDAAERIRKTPLRPTADLVDWPVMAGGAALYPLTFGAVEWLQGLPERMRCDVRVMAYAAAHGRDPAHLERIRHALLALPAVIRWSRGLTCSFDALAAAVDELIGGDEYVEVHDAVPRKRAPDSWQWGAVVQALCTKYPGTSPEYWTWQVSREKAYAMLQQVAAELPKDNQPTEYEIEMNIAFRNITEHLKAEASNGG